MSFTSVSRSRTSLGWGFVCVCVSLVLFWCGFPGCLYVMWQHENCQSKNWLGSFLWISRRLLMACIWQGSRCDQLSETIPPDSCPGAFFPLLPLQAFFQNSTSYLHLVKPISAGNFGQLCRVRAAWCDIQVSQIHFLSSHLPSLNINLCFLAIFLL